MKKFVNINIALLTLVLALAMVLPCQALGAETDGEAEAGQLAVEAEAESENELLETEAEVEAEGDAEGEETPAEGEEEAEADPVAPLVSSAISGDAVVISWEAFPSAKKYRVYRSYSLKGSKTRIKETSSLKYKDRNNDSGRTAYYFVRAYVGKKWTPCSEPVKARIIRVYIETGHGIDSRGKWDPGCTWKKNGVKYQEAKLMLPIARAMADDMTRCGVYVYTDAYRNNDRNLYWTVNFLSSHKVSAFVNIHCDYYKAKSGTLPLYRTSSQKALAKALNKAVHKEIDIRDRGLCKRKDLLSLNSSKVGAPACIFETGSIKADNKLLRTQYQAYGRGLAKGLCNYLGIDYVEEEEPEE